MPLSSETSSPMDPATLRDAFGRFPTGVVAVCAEVGGSRVGMAVSSFVPVSLEPPLVSFCVQRSSTTWPRLRNAGRIGISVLGAAHGSAVRTLSAKDTDRFAGLTTRTTPDGAVHIDAAASWLSTTVTDVVGAGDHEIIVLRVHELQVRDDVAPIVFHRSRLRELAVAS